jgi:hypothetical protein
VLSGCVCFPCCLQKSPWRAQGWMQRWTGTTAPSGRAALGRCLQDPLRPAQALLIAHDEGANSIQDRAQHDVGVLLCTVRRCSTV